MRMRRERPRIKERKKQNTLSSQSSVVFFPKIQRQEVGDEMFRKDRVVLLASTHSVEVNNNKVFTLLMPEWHFQTQPPSARKE